MLNKNEELIWMEIISFFLLKLKIVFHCSYSFISSSLRVFMYILILIVYFFEHLIHLEIFMIFILIIEEMIKMMKVYSSSLVLLVIVILLFYFNFNPISSNMNEEINKIMKWTMKWILDFY